MKSWPNVVLDGEVIQKQLAESLSLGESKNATLLIGSNTKETAMSFASSGWIPLEIKNVTSLAGVLMFAFGNNEKSVEKIIDFCVKPNCTDYLDALIDATGDSFFAINSIGRLSIKTQLECVCLFVFLSRIE